MMLSIAAFLVFSCGSQKSATTGKIKVKEDAFVQGGNTSNQHMGNEMPKILRIFNSNEETKYARTSLLKFELPGKKNDFQKVTLHFPIEVYKKTEYPNAKFHLQVYGTDNNWQESSVTFNTLPKKGDLLGETKIEQSSDGKAHWIEIELNLNKIKTLLNQSKDGKLSFQLRNDEFNRISAKVPSKEQGDKEASYLVLE